jgi:hypothetical protein
MKSLNFYDQQIVFLQHYKLKVTVEKKTKFALHRNQHGKGYMIYELIMTNNFNTENC